MSKEENICVYRHRRLDTNEIFYIGIGVKDRPYCKWNRSKWWNKVVNKTKYEVEILYENLSWEDACELEMFLISLYGRKDLGLGTLVNMTNGGDGTYGLIRSEESKEKMRGENNPFYGKKHSEETRKIMSEYSKTLKGNKNHFYGRKHSEDYKINHKNAKVVLDEECGVYYNTLRDASNILNIPYSKLSKLIVNNKINLKYV